MGNIWEERLEKVSTSSRDESLWDGLVSEIGEIPVNNYVFFPRMLSTVRDAARNDFLVPPRIQSVSPGDDQKGHVRAISEL